ncbi:hypothetical protein J7T62_00415 [Lactobacillus delbrueckii subsp. lactis]|uniref:Bacterial Ig-like domain (Group 2) n=1 Tax=Lactobacillus delbrueckii subsp. lactis TaxID=29397 RepID=A0A3G6K6D2_LACDL|nr:hypothetical protein [Lactobacillus delbrueckii]AZA15826.1 MAG: hypothetical protein DQL93_04140 [Lactobacillus delbrueckii subsp. lactis]AZA25606.1 MAG: hypothetical protein DF199_07560 [Lactobacillus delbrueckii subsp. lactis]MBO1167384.1 hypothetical protein [Lactobacillus delbrueckii subsp. lactis]MBO1169211.1 hypothetical protein [Lactobacillus delbrueckii subsp. lactis]MBO1171056.1 hypothetical protein [Lactobacillus delbrueckii subsp. lactis]
MRRFALGMMTSAALMAGLASQVQASSKDYSKSTKTDLVTKIMGNKSYQVYSSLKLEEVTKKVKAKTKEKKKYTVKKKVAVKKNSKKGKTKYKTVKQVKYKWVTKTAYKNVKKKEWKFGKKLTASADFRYAHVQSKSYKVKGGKRYYYIYVDGRPVGYVNEKAFALSKANVVSQVSLVNNPSDSVGFNAEDAINYVTDQHGSLVDNDSVEISCKSAELNISDTGYVSSRKAGTAVLTFRYGKAKATSKLTVRGDAKEGISSADVTPVKTDLPEIKTWSASDGARLSSSSTTTSKDAVSSSHKYWATNMSGNAKGADIETIFYHPAVLSAPGSSNLEAKVSSAVQGIDFYDNDLVTSNLDLGQADNWEARGHMVYYNMRKVKKYNWQLIPSKMLSFNTWLSYIKNIKVSPYMKLGHGQSVGSTKKYVYVLANWNRSNNWSNSQELIRVKKSTMEIDKIWTFKVWNGSAKYPRIFLNADVIDDNTLLALFHNASKHRYEYWKISRNGDSFKAKEVGATGSNLISNSAEVQGFVWNSAYDVYYIAFNDYLFKIGAGLDGKTDAGKLLNRYKFHTRPREFEGLSSYKAELYVNLNHPTETLKVNHITK